MKDDPPTRVRFGLFELDLETGELCWLESGQEERKVLLQEQPFQVLRTLVENGGGIATREEIKKKLWPNDTIVDFDHSINVAIGTLRRLLGDSAGQPKYIETVARRGYRLMLPVEPVEVDLGPGDASPRIDNTDPADQPVAHALIGRKVSHYRVLEVIGGGGMGMVYKAEDLRLGRRVALKFLPEEMTHDPVSLQRFEREARTASSLNHASICTIFGVAEYEDQPFIIMELLDGETLRDRLITHKSKMIPLDQLMEIAIHICDGLQAAHDKGIIHRDIKPANIFLTKHGGVKILDFGLAKLMAMESGAENEPREASPSPRSVPTAETEGVDATLTHTGIAMGTASYMSPEQVRREKLDARTDLFSFGLVLYEMTTGQRAFTGEGTTGVHDAILTQTPLPVRDLNPDVPPGLEAVIAKALQKDRTYRYQSAADMRADLELVRNQRPPQVLSIWKWLASAALLLIIVGGAWIYWRVRTQVRLSAFDTIVLADFNNQTSDPVFDDALNTALRVEFEQTPFLQTLAADKVRGNLKVLNHRIDAKVTPEIALEVCRRTNSKALVASSIADVGNRFRIELKGVDCQTGKTFARSSQDVAARDEIVHALGIAGSRLRGEMGEPKGSLKKFNKPLEEATSASLEALQQLTQGYWRHYSPDPHTAIAFYQRAIDIDPSFALAYAALGARHANASEFVDAASAIKKAYELRSRLTEQNRFGVESLYFDIGTWELEKAYQVHKEWVKTFPADVSAHSNFATSLKYLGRFNESAAQARDAVRLMPSGPTHGILLESTILADQLNDAKAVYEDARAHGFDTLEVHVLRHLLAFLQRDEQAMKEQLMWARGKNEDEALMLWRESDVQNYYGRFRNAHKLIQQAMDLLKMDVLSGRKPHMRETDALRAIEGGNLAEGEKLIEGTARQSHDRDQQLVLALALARAGNVEQAQELIETLSREFPLDTLMQNYSLPTIRAAMKLHENDPAGAIETLRPALRYDLAYPEAFNSLYPAYIRGLAYLQSGDGRSAAVEFQKVIDHPTVVGRFITGALAHLQLGRAQAMMGDRITARKSYRDFLALWKNADPDIPIYKQAIAEYAKLE